MRRLRGLLGGQMLEGEPLHLFYFAFVCERDAEATLPV
jgi:hypothetical protein